MTFSAQKLSQQRRVAVLFPRNGPLLTAGVIKNTQFMRLNAAIYSRRGAG